MRRQILFTTLSAMLIATSCLGQADPKTGSSSLDLDDTAASKPFARNLAALQGKPAAKPASAAHDWRVEFNIWLWLLGVEGDVGVRGLSVDVNADFGDILDASDSLFAFSGHLEVGKGRWGGFIDGLYSNIGADNRSGPLGLADIDITFEMILIDFGLMYRIGEWTPMGDAARHLLNTTLDLYAGARYTYLDVELDPATLAARSRDIDWFDPIIGAKLVLPFAAHWHIRANADIGGFGVESDVTWSTTAVVGYDFRIFKHPAMVLFGYRALGQDFTDGSGTEKFTWDVVLHGPILGFSLFF